LLRQDHTVFVGVINPINPTVETAADVRDRVIEAASIQPAAQLEMTDDCDFAPFADDISTAREIAFSKIRARVEGTELGWKVLGCSATVIAPPLESKSELSVSGTPPEGPFSGTVG
jgi:5-methyltetrahydropteroyltriglutamate--homocysteine methyltransferase